MKKQISLLILIGATLLACNPKPAPESQDNVKQIAKNPVDSTLVNAPNQNSFAAQAAIGGMMEVESSARMIKHTENPDIQTLATMMVKDHGAANKELQAIAKKEKIYLPQTLPDEKLIQLKKLDSLHEEENNRYYADLMVKEHQQAVALFENAAASETNISLKSFAAKHLPTLKQHLMHAQTVKKIAEATKTDKGDMPLKLSKDKQ